MDLQQWIDIIKWVLGLMIIFIAYLFTKWTAIKDLLHDLNSGQQIMSNRLGYIENDMKKMTENNEKVRDYINENHSELSVLKSELTSLKKEFEEWKSKL